MPASVPNSASAISDDYASVIGQGHLNMMSVHSMLKASILTGFASYIVWTVSKKSVFIGWTTMFFFLPFLLVILYLDSCHVKVGITWSEPCAFY